MNASRSHTPRTATGRLPGKPVCSDIGSLVVSRCCRAANGSVSRKLALDCAPRSGRPPWSGERRAPSGVAGTRGRGLLGGLNGGGEKLAAGREFELVQDEDVLDTWFSSWLWTIEVFHGVTQPNNAEINYYLVGRAYRQPSVAIDREESGALALRSSRRGVLCRDRALPVEFVPADHWTE